MSTRGMQYIINNASGIEISRAKTVGQLVVRSGRIRTAERASQVPWQMIVSPPGASRYEDVRDVIEGITLTDRNRIFYIDFNSTAGLNYITEYQGELNTTQQAALSVSTATGWLGQASFDVSQPLNYIGESTTSTFDYMRIENLPEIGAVISTNTVSVTAWAFPTAVNATYSRAFSTSRTDFLIKTSDYDPRQYIITTGLEVQVPTYVTGGQTISTITRNYITISGVSYTRIVMSAAANANSTVPTTEGAQNVTVSIIDTETVTANTVIFAAGDWVQFSTEQITQGTNYAPENYTQALGQARTVPLTVLRGTGDYVDVPVHRPWSFTGSGSYTSNARRGCDINIGKQVRIRFVLTKMPSWKLLPGKIVQWTGDFELFEWIGG